MTKSMVKYKRNLPARTTMSTTGTIAIIVLIALVLYFLLKNKSGTIGQYKNLETWDVQYSPDGLPTKISIHREATRT